MNAQAYVARPGARPTMKDVAVRAGVALKTVSRVVNGEPGVTPETANRVLGAIAELGFKRNESARLLRTGRTATIGFISDNWGNREHAVLGRGVEEVAREHGYLLFAGSTDEDPACEEQLTMSMCARRVDGLIIVPNPGPHDYLISEIEAGIATVFALRPPEQMAADAVLVDERGAAKTSVAHLIQQGHRRIGYVGEELSGYRSGQLLGGYRDAMTEAGFSWDENWLSLTPERLADLTVTAVLCGSREHTARALRALAASGNPRQVTVIGFGPFELAEHLAPGVTLMAYDPGDVGRAAADLLFERLAGYDGPPRRVEVSATLYTRAPADRPAATT